MPKSKIEPTNAENLEARFDAGEDVLDYLDLNAARVIRPDEIAAATRPSVIDLKRAIQLTKQIERLEGELSRLLQNGAPTLTSANAALR